MMQLFITTFFLLIAIYLVAGFIFSILFLARGIQKIDEGAHATNLAFRLIIFPGCVVFWPVLLRLWLHATKSQANDHS